MGNVIKGTQHCVLDKLGEEEYSQERERREEGNGKMRFDKRDKYYEFEGQIRC